MRILVTCLLSALLILSIHNKQTPIQHIDINTRSNSPRAESDIVKIMPKESAREVHSDVPEQTTPQTTSSAESEQTQPTPQVAVAPTSDPEAEAKAFIYHKESSTNPKAENYLGCYGLGQDCNGIVKKKCGADYACQDAFFTDYAFRRYGSWAKAKQFWLARVPINGIDRGNWW